MKKKSIISTLGVAMAAGLGMVSSPAGQQVIEQVSQPTQQTVVSQQAQRTNGQRAAQQQAQNRAKTGMQRSLGVMNPYIPSPGGGLLLR